MPPIAAHPPANIRDKPRVDDRRVISGTVHVLKSGGPMFGRLKDVRRIAETFLASV